jgi:predicted nucleic acid-binding protein
MIPYVIDAGVAVKWFIPEADTAKARRLLELFHQGAADLAAPDLLIAEAANVFWKRANRNDITAQEAEDNLNDYLALALDRGCDLVTTDERLVNAIGGQFPQIKLLRDLQI